MKLPWAVVSCVMVMSAWGCQMNWPGKSGGEVKTATDASRDTAAAAKHNDQACELIERGQLPEAQREAKAALAADSFFGPAHNTLGIVYYRQKDYYQGAIEFQTAAQLMPRQVQPRNNLGLVLEAAGKLNDAAKAFEDALALDPSSTELMGNLARVYIRLNRNDERTRQLLQDIVMKDSRADWVSWARERLALMGKADTPTTSSSVTK